ncbi:MAG: hypothetical protein ABI373_06545 [Flavobacteriales bacterium]
MNRPIRFLVLAAAFTIGPMIRAQPQANGREMGFAVSNAQDGDFAAALSKAQAACMSVIQISVSWSELHPDTSTWNPTVLEQLDLMNSYFSAIGLKIELQLRPTNTVVEEIPGELEGLPYDDPLVVHAMLVTLDTVFAHLTEVNIAALNIGNESDALWGTDTARYADFGNLLTAVIPHAKVLYQALHSGDTLSVGTTFTWGGLTDPIKASLCQLTEASCDHISATYYGIHNDFTVKPPADVITDLDLLTTMQPGTKPIRLAEIGYPTSSTCASSEYLQSDFVQDAFAAWDQHMDRIHYYGWFLTTDWDSATVDTLGVYYGITSPIFLEYLRTLGLRTWPGSGTDKQAYQTLLCELQARGFCTTTCTNGIPEQTSQKKVGLMPNPAVDLIAITGTKLRTGDPVRFISITGQNRAVLPFAEEMDISSLPSGTYAVMMLGYPPSRLVVVKQE